MPLSLHRVDTLCLPQQMRVHLWYLHAGHHISAEEKPLLWRCRAPDIVQ